jgi:hypothetical protein
MITTPAVGRGARGGGEGRGDPVKRVPWGRGGGTPAPLAPPGTRLWGGSAASRPSFPLVARQRFGGRLGRMGERVLGRVVDGASYGSRVMNPGRRRARKRPRTAPARRAPRRLLLRRVSVCAALGPRRQPAPHGAATRPRHATATARGGGAPRASGAARRRRRGEQVRVRAPRRRTLAAAAASRPAAASTHGARRRCVRRREAPGPRAAAAAAPGAGRAQGRRRGGGRRGRRRGASPRRRRREGSPRAPARHTLLLWCSVTTAPPPPSARAHPPPASRAARPVGPSRPRARARAARGWRGRAYSTLETLSPSRCAARSPGSCCASQWPHWSEASRTWARGMTRSTTPSTSYARKVRVYGAVGRGVAGPRRRRRRRRRARRCAPSLSPCAGGACGLPQPAAPRHPKPLAQASRPTR